MEIAQYVFFTLCDAENAREDDYYPLCKRRSAIQVLLDDYAGAPLADVGPTTVANLDVEMRRLGEQYGPVPATFVPAGLPATHWWWRFPTSG